MDVEVYQAEPEDEEDSATVPEHKCRKRGRKKRPDSLPRVDVVHELLEVDRIFPHDDAILAEIGEEVSEQPDIISAKLQVLRHIRKK